MGSVKVAFSRPPTSGQRQPLGARKQSEKQMKQLLKSCPWCKESLELGIVEGAQGGIRWFETEASTFKRMWIFTGEPLGNEFIAQRCRSCNIVILVGKR
jgi:NAD-dependent SIR2 family protein deacetylase